MFLSRRTFFQFLSYPNMGLLLTLLLLSGPAPVLAENHPLTYSAVTVRDREATIAAHTGIVSVLSQALKTDIQLFMGGFHDH